MTVRKLVVIGLTLAALAVLSAAGKAGDDRGLGPQFHEFLNARGFTHQYRSGEGSAALSRTFVVAAEPVIRGMTGTLAFGLDETGRICVVAAAQNPRSGRLLEGGRLRPDCDSTE